MVEKDREKIMNLLSEYSGPSLVFDENKFISNLSRIRKASQRTNTHVVMAAKSCTLDISRRIAMKYLSGFEVSNSREFAGLPDQNHHKESLLFVTNPILGCDHSYLFNKHYRTFVHVDSFHQFLELQKIERPLEFGIRLSVDEEGAINYQRRDVVTSRFGISFDQIGEIMQEAAASHHRLRGVHVHHQRKRVDVKAFHVTTKCILECIPDVEQFEYINLGGGLSGIGIEGFEGFLAQIRSEIPKKIKLIFEPGSLLFQGVVSAIGKIMNIKKIRNSYVLFMDISKECHLKWSDPVPLLPQSRTGKFTYSISICGPTCFEGDLIGQYKMKSDSKSFPLYVGQVIHFLNVESYSQAWNTEFNGIPRAQIMWQQQAE
ncbi:MAG: hypothetical protein A3I05_02405 [Deltaproteobacteria bacterium RIFCSPLOWO2_02_FULL_44_10]|nr:MAG: hypothetical protein A3I05_02405 [Deltaproteobacteria bacterium RIFCSPLOWO2_02_FULL_44_10]